MSDVEGLNDLSKLCFFENQFLPVSQKHWQFTSKSECHLDLAFNNVVVSSAGSVICLQARKSLYI